MGALPSFPTPPEVPQTPLEERRFEAAGLELRPLRGPTIPVPGEQDEELQRRFEEWKAEHGYTQASLPEFIAWEFLVYRKKQVEGVDFLFQSPYFGGRTEFGGFVLDFYLVIQKYAWRIQGERFHIFFPRDRARDLIARAQLEGEGITVIDIFENDVLVRPDFILELAWNGQEAQGHVGQ